MKEISHNIIIMEKFLNNDDLIKNTPVDHTHINNKLYAGSNKNRKYINHNQWHRLHKPNRYIIGISSEKINNTNFNQAKIKKMDPNMLYKVEPSLTHALLVNNFEILSINNVLNIVNFGALTELNKELETFLIKNHTIINWNRIINNTLLINFIINLSDNNEFIKIYKNIGNGCIGYLLDNNNFNLDKIDKLLSCKKSECYLKFPITIIALDTITHAKSDETLIKMYDLFKKHNIDFDMLGNHRNVLLYYIRYYINTEDNLIKYFINAGCDVNLTDSYLNNCGHYVFFRNNLSEEILKLILSKIDDINYQNYNGYSILYYIIKSNTWEKYKDILATKSINLFSKSKAVYDIAPKEFLEFVKQKYNVDNILKLKNIEILDVNIGDYQYSTTFMYKPNILLIMYSIYNLLDTNDELGIPFYPDKLQINIKKNYENHTFNQYMNNPDTLLAFKIIPHLHIVWFDDNNYFIAEKFYEAINNTIAKNKKFIVIYLVVSLDIDLLHANMLILDVVKKTIFHFEPYGYIPKNQKLYEQLGSKLESIIKDFKYISPMKFAPKKSYQTISNEHDYNNMKTTDKQGYCASWCLWFIELYINNNKYDIKTLIEKSIKKLINNKYSINEHIRNYANYRTNLMNDTLLYCGLNYTNLNDANIIDNPIVIDCFKNIYKLL
jgi:hypothetical protein